MAINTPIYRGLAQSDLDMAGFDLLNWSGGGGGGGGGDGNPLLTANVKDAPYNAVGNGIADDTVAIQSAINAVAAAGGGTVYFPAGTYLCNGPFDATTNSILKIPFISSSPPIPITLLGNSPATFPSPYAIGTGGSRIISTKTGTGSGPAIFAAGAYQTPPGTPSIAVFNNTNLYIRDLAFRVPPNPTLYGIRCDSAENLNLTNVEVDIDGTPGTQPTHGTCGVTMPFSNSSGPNMCQNVIVFGFDTGIRAGEGFMMLNGAVGQCNTGIDFTSASQMSSVIAPQIVHCGKIFSFSGNHVVWIVVDIEHYPAGADWRVTTADVYDPGNWAFGEITYMIVAGGIGYTTDPLLVTGGNWISSTNLYTGIKKIAPSGSLMIGADARLTPVSGGVKLEARNTGTGIWVEAARWTNP